MFLCYNLVIAFLKIDGEKYSVPCGRNNVKFKFDVLPHHFTYFGQVYGKNEPSSWLEKGLKNTWWEQVYFQRLLK